MSVWQELFSLIGPLSIALMLILMGLLSRRLGRVTDAAPYYIGFFVAAMLVGVGVLARLFSLTAEAAAKLQGDTLYLILENGFPAAGVTLGVIIAWRYWSWLLAERD